MLVPDVQQSISVIYIHKFILFQILYPHRLFRILIGRTDAEAEAPILWPSDVKGQPIRKEPDAGKC